MIYQYLDAIPENLSQLIVDHAEKNGVWQQSGLINPADGTINRYESQRTDSEIWLERTLGMESIREQLEPIFRPMVDAHPLAQQNPRDYVFYEMRVLKYEVGGFLGMHRDNDKIIRYNDNAFYGSREHIIGDASYRWLTICAYLSEHQGGELKFIDGNIVESQSGSVVLFPGSTAEYMHESLPVTQGTKYVLTTWVCS